MRLKLNNKCKVLIGSIVFSTGLTSLYDISSLAYSKGMSYLNDISSINRSIRQSENIDITNKSMVKGLGGSNIDYLVTSIETSDKGMVAVGYSYSNYPEWTNKGTTDAFIVKYDKYGEQEWLKHFGGSGYDYFNSVIETSDKGFLVVGDTDSTNAGFNNKGGYDAIMVKYDSNGNQDWIKNFGGSSSDGFESISNTSDGNFIISGLSSSTNIGFVSNGNYDAIILKCDEEGNQIWIKNYGGSSVDSFDSVIETSDGGFIAIGESASATSDFTKKGYDSALIVKYNKDGNKEWAKTFGGSKYDYFNSVIETSDKGFIAVGYTTSTNAGFNNKGGYDAIMVKYDSNGNQQWIKDFGGSSSDFFYSILKTDTNDILVGGYTSSKDAVLSLKGYSDVIVVKYNENGNQKEIICFGGSDSEYLNSITKSSNNGFIIAGYGNSSDIGVDNQGSNDGFIVKYNDNCKYNESLFLSINDFDKNRSNNDIFNSVAELSDGSYVAVGYSYSNNIGFDNNGGSDAILVKYSKSGTVEWIKNFGGSGDDYFNSVVKTSDGGFMTAGYSYSTDIGFINKGNVDAVIVKYNKDGEKEWIKNFGGSNDESFYSIKETSDKGFIAVGYSESSNAGFNSKGSGDAVIVKYSSNGEQEWIKSFGGSKEDYFIQAIQTSDSGFVVVGYTNSTDAGFSNKGEIDAIIIKYNKDGEQEWIKSFGGSKSNPDYIVNYDCFIDVIECSDNGFIVVGDSISSDAGFTNKGLGDAIIIKYDLNGNQQWIKSFGGSGSDCFYSVIETSDKGFMAFGYSGSEDTGFTNKGVYDIIIVKYDSNGNQLWVKNFGGSSYEYIYSGIKTNDNNIVLVGKSASTFDDYKNTGGYDTLILKYDSNGNQTWVKSIPIKVRNTQEDYDNMRYLINKIENEELKRYLNEKLNNIPLNLELEIKSNSANLDIYIKSENMLLMNLSTNSITFNDYSGLNEIEQQNAVEISINSSLPYQLNAYLLEEMYNNDKTKKIDMDRLQIKDNEDIDYKEFTNINEKLVLKDSCESGNDKSHSIDIKLKGGNAYESDIYKTVIKFEAEQK